MKTNLILLLTLALAVPAGAVTREVRPSAAPLISAQEKADYAYLASRLQNELYVNEVYLALLPEAKAYFTARGEAIQYALNAVLTEKLTGYELSDVQDLDALFNTLYVISEGDEGYQSGVDLAAALVGNLEDELL